MVIGIFSGDWKTNKEINNMCYRKKTLSNGQSALYTLWFPYQDVIYQKKTIDVYVAFGIADKYKVLKDWMFQTGHGDLDITATGKCGLEGLIWAKENTIEAARDIQEYNKTHDKKIRLIVEATTPQRFKIYKRALSSYGFIDHKCDGIHRLIYK